MLASSKLVHSCRLCRSVEKNFFGVCPRTDPKIKKFSKLILGRPVLY